MPQKLTWIPRETMPSCLRLPDPDGKQRMYLCFDDAEGSAAITLHHSGMYLLGYAGMSWPLGTADILRAIERAGTLLEWADFRERPPENLKEISNGS